MDTYGRLINDNTLRFERMLPGPIENVWKYLVDPEKRGRWFSSGTMDTKSGAEIQFVFDHSRLSPEEDPIPEKYRQYAGESTSVAHIVEVKPPELLKFNWEEGLVTIELQEMDQEVKLTLTHEKLQKEMDYRVGVMAGWHTHLDILVDHLNGRTPKGFWKVHMPLEEYYQNQLD